MLSEDCCDGLCLGDVSDRCGGAVYVDVVNVFRLHSGIFECILHNECGTESFGVRCSDVVCIGAHSHAGKFAVDLCTAGLGMFKFLKDEHTCTFAHDEAVAAGAEGAAGTCGVVVAGREGMHGIEASYSARSDGSFCTAGYHDVGLAETDEVKGGSNGVGAGCTCRGGGVVGAMEAILYGNLSGSDVGNHLGDEERVESRTAFCAVDGVV